MHYLKQAVQTRKASNVDESKQFCKEEWPKFPPLQCERLIATYSFCGQMCQNQLDVAGTQGELGLDNFLY